MDDDAGAQSRHIQSGGKTTSVLFGNADQAGFCYAGTVANVTIANNKTRIPLIIAEEGNNHILSEMIAMLLMIITRQLVTSMPSAV